MISLFFGAQNDAIATKANASDVYTLNVTPKTDIAENTNLGSLLTPGKYVCNSSAIAATLLNAPYNTNKVTYVVTHIVGMMSYKSGYDISGEVVMGKIEWVRYVTLWL